MALHDLGVDAVSLTGGRVGIATDGAHRRAKIIRISTGKIAEHLARGTVVVVAGFQGVDEDLDITTARPGRL